MLISVKRFNSNRIVRYNVKEGSSTMIRENIYVLIVLVVFPIS